MERGGRELLLRRLWKLDDRTREGVRRVERRLGWLRLLIVVVWIRFVDEEESFDDFFLRSFSYVVNAQCAVECFGAVAR
ncbi:MAG: hypothetical protein CL917_03320 [Deltaproteobacteria bacterium]|nr:hypothetical protein [Deltaproteobacteria bacterium]